MVDAGYIREQIAWLSLTFIQAIAYGVYWHMSRGSEKPRVSVVLFRVGVVLIVLEFAHGVDFRAVLGLYTPAVISAFATADAVIIALGWMFYVNETVRAVVAVHLSTDASQSQRITSWVTFMWRLTVLMFAILVLGAVTKTVLIFVRDQNIYNGAWLLVLGIVLATFTVTMLLYLNLLKSVLSEHRNRLASAVGSGFQDIDSVGSSSHDSGGSDVELAGKSRRRSGADEALMASAQVLRRLKVIQLFLALIGLIVSALQFSTGASLLDTSRLDAADPDDYQFFTATASSYLYWAVHIIVWFYLWLGWRRDTDNEQIQ